MFLQRNFSEYFNLLLCKSNITIYVLKMEIIRITAGLHKVLKNKLKIGYLSKSFIVLTIFDWGSVNQSRKIFDKNLGKTN